MLQTNDKPLASFSFIGRYYTLHNNSLLHYNLVLLKSNLKTILRIVQIIMNFVHINLKFLHSLHFYSFGMATVPKVGQWDSSCDCLGNVI